MPTDGIINTLGFSNALTDAGGGVGGASECRSPAAYHVEPAAAAATPPYLTRALRATLHPGGFASGTATADTGLGYGGAGAGVGGFSSDLIVAKIWANRAATCGFVTN